MTPKSETVEPEQIFELLRQLDTTTGTNGVEQAKTLDEADHGTRARCYGLAVFVTLLVNQDTSDNMLRRVQGVGNPALDRTTRDRLREIAVEESCKVIESLDTSR